MFKNIEPEDVAIRPFQVHKKFTFTNNDSGSGVYGLVGVSGSTYNFKTSTADSQSFGVRNELSASLGKEPYIGTFYKLATYSTINQLYYKDLDVHGQSINLEHWMKPSSSFDSAFITSSNEVGEISNRYRSRVIHSQCNVITIPRQFYGERIQANSVVLNDDSTDSTLIIKDDGLGNLYDNQFSASYSIASQSVGSDGQISGSVIGNVIYEHGLLIITDTGSSYVNVGATTGTDGWEVDFKSTQTIFEREYLCSIQPNELTRTTNVSLFPGNSGSWQVGSGSLISRNTKVSSSDNVWAHLDIPPGSSSYKEFYAGTGSYKPMVTGSDFSTYVTGIGLYDDFNNLLAIGKLAKPVKNDKEMAMSFVIRFDT